MERNKSLIIGISFVLVIIIISISLYFLRLNRPISDNKNIYHKVVLKNNDKIREVKVEFAQTYEEQRIGLMNRKSLDGTDGMLFIFDNEEFQSFWMKDTYIALDIIFFDSSFRFVNIHKDAQPCIGIDEVCKSYPSASKIKYVLETKSGFLSDDLVGEGMTLEIKE